MTMVEAMSIIKRIGVGSGEALRGTDLKQPPGQRSALPEWEKDSENAKWREKRREEDEMTVLLRILGHFWLAFSGVAISIIYGFIWIVEDAAGLLLHF